MSRGTDYYELAFAPLRQSELDMGSPAVEMWVPLGQSDIALTYTEAHRHACEVRYVRDLDPEARALFLKRVEAKRGVEAAARLRAGVEAG